MCGALAHVRFVPKADSCTAANSIPFSYSGMTSPEPPNSLGKSFSLGSPSRIGRTVSDVWSKAFCTHVIDGDGSVSEMRRPKDEDERAGALCDLDDY
jgi:hypothetical protein